MFKLICLLMVLSSAIVSAETVDCRRIARSRAPLMVNGEVRSSILDWPPNVDGFYDCAGVPDGPMYEVLRIQASADYPAGLRMFLFHCSAGKVIFRDSDRYILNCAK